MNLAPRHFRRICECVRYPGFIAAPLVLIGLLGVAPASAQPPKPIPPPEGPTQLPQFDPVTRSGYCDGFAAVFEYTNLNQKILHDTTDENGFGSFDVIGNAQATVTNKDTGKSIAYNVSGPGTVVVNPDGFSVDAHGPNLFYTEKEKSFPGVPAISYTTGHLTFAVAAGGQTTSYTLAGRQTDVCAALA